MRKRDVAHAGLAVLEHQHRPVVHQRAVVRAGDPLYTLSTDEPARFAQAHDAIGDALVISPQGTPVVDVGPLVLDRIA